MDPGLPMLTVPHPVTAVGGPGPPLVRPEELAVRTLLDYVLEHRIGGTDDLAVYRARRLPGDVTVAIKMAADGLDPDDGDGPVALVLAWDDVGPTRPAHPGNPTSRRSPRRRRPGWRAAAMVGAATVVLAVLVLVVVIGLPMSLTGSPGPAAGRVEAAATVRNSAPVVLDPAPCPGASAAVPAGAVAVPGDLTGAGCLVTVVWWPDRAIAERPDSAGGYDRFALGQPGDQLVLGDWDDDGRDTPALYSPRSGRISCFDQWAPGTETIDATVVSTDALLDGLAQRQRGDARDVVVVEPAPADQSPN